MPILCSFYCTSFATMELIWSVNQSEETQDLFWRPTGRQGGPAKRPVIWGNETGSLSFKTVAPLERHPQAYTVIQLLDRVVLRSSLPFVSSSPCPHIIINFSTPTPHIIINFSTTAPQNMFPSPHVSCPITFPNSTLTHLTIYFPLTIFLVILSLFFPMFSPVIPIHVPNFLRIFLCPAFPIPQANIACCIFSPV